MNREKAKREAEGELHEWQRRKLEARKSVGLRIMVHGGNPDFSPRISQGLTKRQQIRQALDSMPYVAETIFADSPALERELFERCDGTVILVEEDPLKMGARFELASHAAQPGASHKLAFFYPEDERALQGAGYLAQLVEETTDPHYRWPYSSDDYVACRLIPRALAFAEALRNRAAEDIFDDEEEEVPRDM